MSAFFLGQGTITKAKRDEILAFIADKRKKNEELVRYVENVKDPLKPFGEDSAAYDLILVAAGKEVETIWAIEAKLKPDAASYPALTGPEDTSLELWGDAIDDMYAIYRKQTAGIPIWVYGGAVFAAALAALAIFSHEEKFAVKPRSFSPGRYKAGFDVA